MDRSGHISVLAFLLPFFFSLSARAQPRLEEALALQETLQEIIKRAEPAIASLAVSHSGKYRQFGSAPSPEEPGRLGDFDALRYLGHIPPFDQSRIDLIKRLDLADPENVPESYGSGVAIDPNGLILTNFHVVREAAKVYVRLPGFRGSYADIYAADPRSDLAVLKMLAPPTKLTVLSLGRGEDLRKGQMVLALANPHAAGFKDGSPSASWGIVSNLRRRAPGAPPREEERTRTLHHYGTLVQTDARLNLGCSGGALIDLKGEFVGLTSALAAVTGTDVPGGFAVPMTSGMRRIIDRLREGKEVEYGFLGISFRLDQGGNGGVRIADVAVNSPAADAGLKPELYIRKIDGTPIHDVDELFLAIGTALAGSRVRLDVSAEPQGPVQEKVAELAKFYIPGKCIAANRPPALGGLRIDYASTLIRSGGSQRALPRGVVVREVLPGSQAEKANVQVEGVITQVNGQPVTNPTEFYRAVGRAGGQVDLTFSNDEKVKLNLR
jgi:S1-C subfamily serine protease